MNRRISWLWCVALLVISGFGWIPDPSLRTARLIVLEWGCWLLLAASLPPRRGWILLWAVVCSATHYNPLSYLALTAFGLTWLALDVMTTADKKIIPRILTAWRILTILQLVFMVIQVAGYDPIFVDTLQGPYPKPCGFLDNTMLAGQYLAIASPLLMTGTWILLLPLLIAMIFLAKATAALLVVAFLFWWKFHRKNKALSVIVPLSLLVVFGTFCKPLSQKLWTEMFLFRGQVWLATWKLAHMNWVTAIKGWGLGQFTPAFQGIAKAHHVVPFWLAWDHPHNEWVLLLFEQGWIGVLLWSAALIALARRVTTALSQRPDTSLALLFQCGVAWLLTSLYGFPAHVASLSILGVVIWALLEASLRED